MCGIVGIIDYEGEIEERVVRRMAAQLVHRGPDAEGYAFLQNCAFGHRRLSIVDVHNGRQPTANEDESVVIVFNGEIYNYRDLIEDLTRRGHRLRSASDAEVIPHLYEELGPDFVHELDGDFAIALWDRRKKTLLLTRDPVGVKPLFYAQQGKWLAFGSEVKAIYGSGRVSSAVSPQGLADCMHFGQCVGAGTFWEGIWDLEPGTVLTFSASGVNGSRYFMPLQPDEPMRISNREAIGQFRELFVEAVRKRLPAEVDAGACLSGGIDSTGVAALAHKMSGRPIHTSTIRLPGEILDESAYSRRAARDLGLSNSEIEIRSGDARAELETALWHLESPQFFGVAPPFVRLSADARARGFKVALTGDGADELLGGYEFYRVLMATRAASRLGIGGMVGPIFERAARWIGSPKGVGAHLGLMSTRLPDLERQHGGVPAWAYVWCGVDEMSSGLLSDARKPSPLPKPPEQDFLRRSVFFEYPTRLSKWVLVLSDRLSMANSVEVRVPFLDRDLLRFAANCKSGLLMRWGVEKFVLKKACAGIVPDYIIRRRKKPFFTPVAPWFLWEGDLVNDYLSASRTREMGFFNPARLDRILERARSEAGSWNGMTAEWVAMMALSTHMLVERFRKADFLAEPMATDPARETVIRQV